MACGCRCCTWYRCSTSNLQWQSRHAACFLRDTAGALGLHRAAPLQYIRPELIGLVLGALASAYFSKEFRPRGGSTPLARIILGFFAMALCGLCFALGGGCPGKQLVNIGEGNNDAALFVLGMLLGAAAAHNFGLAASPTGVTAYTPHVLVLGFAACVYIGLTNKSKA